jgi:hypothetical protein
MRLAMEPLSVILPVHALHAASSSISPGIQPVAYGRISWLLRSQLVEKAGRERIDPFAQGVNLCATHIDIGGVLRVSALDIGGKVFDGPVHVSRHRTG